MAGNTNYKCRFFKSVEDNGRVANFMLPGQPPYTDKQGAKKDWDTSIQVISVDIKFAQGCKDGEVYAAALIDHSSQRGCYMVRGTIYKVQDEDGVLITDGNGDADYEAAISLWDAFSSGNTAAFNAPTKQGATTHAAKVLSELEKVKANKKYAPPTISSDGFYVPTDLWYDLVMCAKNNVSVLLLGPKGTGKTELIDLVSKKLGYGYDCFDMSIQNPYSYLCGNTRLNDKGETTFQYARFASLIQVAEPTILCLDELSRCAPSASNILLPVLDRRRTLFVENAIDENGRVLEVGEKITFWATANMGAEYLGVAGLDEALFDRFVVLETSYPPKKEESLLLQVRCNLNAQMANLLAGFAERVRNSKDISTKISTRKVLEIGRWVSWGYEPVKAVEKVALSIWPEDETDGGERTAVRAIMQMLN